MPTRVGDDLRDFARLEIHGGTLAGRQSRSTDFSYIRRWWICLQSGELKGFLLQFFEVFSASRTCAQLVCLRDHGFFGGLLLGLGITFFFSIFFIVFRNFDLLVARNKNPLQCRLFKPGWVVVIVLLDFFFRNLRGLFLERTVQLLTQNLKAGKRHHFLEAGLLIQSPLLRLVSHQHQPWIGGSQLSAHLERHAGLERVCQLLEFRTTNYSLTSSFFTASGGSG